MKKRSLVAINVPVGTRNVRRRRSNGQGAVSLGGGDGNVGRINNRAAAEAMVSAAAANSAAARAAAEAAMRKTEKAFEVAMKAEVAEARAVWQVSSGKDKVASKKRLEELLRIEATWLSRHKASYSPKEGLVGDNEAEGSHHGDAAPVGTTTTSSERGSPGGTEGGAGATVTAMANRSPPSVSAKERTCAALSPSPPRDGAAQVAADSSDDSRNSGAVAEAISPAASPPATTEVKDKHERAARETLKAPEVTVQGNGDGTGGSGDVGGGTEEGHRERGSGAGSPSSADKSTHETEQGLNQEFDTPECKGGEEQVSEESARRSGEEACASPGSGVQIYGWNELLTVDLVLWYFRYFGARDKIGEGDDVDGCRGTTFDHDQQVYVYVLLCVFWVDVYECVY